jgi:hypothetical protein
MELGVGPLLRLLAAQHQLRVCLEAGYNTLTCNGRHISLLLLLLLLLYCGYLLFPPTARLVFDTRR